MLTRAITFGWRRKCEKTRKRKKEEKRKGEMQLDGAHLSTCLESCKKS